LLKIPTDGEDPRSYSPAYSKLTRISQRSYPAFRRSLSDVSQNLQSLLPPREEIPVTPFDLADGPHGISAVVIGPLPRISAAREELERFVGARLKDSVARVLPEDNPWRQLRLFVCKIPLVGGPSHRRPQGLSSPLVGPRTCPGQAKRAACPVSLRVLLAVQSHWDNLRTMRAIVSRRRTCSSAGLYGEAARR
jgi:hypothetical protein